MSRQGLRRSAVALAVSALGVAGCTESPTTVEFQVIEEVDFAPELDIDLATFEQTGNGVYYKDIAVGGGDPAVFGGTLTITFTGWLVDGTVFADGTYTFTMGENRVPVGLEDGLLGLKAGGTRKVIVPPGRGFGGIESAHPQGTMLIPGGSVLVYEVMLDGVT